MAKTKRTDHMTDADYIARLKTRCILVESGCLEWNGCCSTTGYGKTSYRGKLWTTHRLMFTLLNGPVPRKMDVCHSCDNRRCINPAHLWLGTRQQNLQDASSKGRMGNQLVTHCPRGHAYAEHGMKGQKPHWRKCGACVRARGRIERGWSEVDAYSVPSLKHPTHCKYGHPFSGENSYTNRLGVRICRTCVRDRAKRRYQITKYAREDIERVKREACCEGT